MQHKQIIIFIFQIIRGVTNSRAALYQLSLLVCFLFYFLFAIFRDSAWGSFNGIAKVLSSCQKLIICSPY